MTLKSTTKGELGTEPICLPGWVHVHKHPLERLRWSTWVHADNPNVPPTVKAKRTVVYWKYKLELFIQVTKKQSTISLRFFLLAVWMQTSGDLCMTPYLNDVRPLIWLQVTLFWSHKILKDWPVLVRNKRRWWGRARFVRCIRSSRCSDWWRPTRASLDTAYSTISVPSGFW